MTLRMRKPGALWPALALGASFAGALAGCGGGTPAGVWVTGSSPASTPASTPAPASGPVPALYLPAIASANTATAATMLGVNPLDAATPGLSAPMTDANGGPTTVFSDPAYTGTSAAHTTAAYSFDAAARSYGYLGETRAYYVSGGRIYRASLVGSQSRAPVQLSYVANACFIEHHYQGNAAATDNWVGVYTWGADGKCSTTADASFVMVRDSATATSAPSYFPSGTSHAEIVTDADGKALGFVVLASGVFRYYDWSMNLVGSVTNGTTGNFWHFAWIGELGGQKTAYLLVNGSPTTVRALTYTATGATLSDSLYSFSGRHPTSVPGIGGWDAAWFADGNRLLRLTGTGAATPFATLAAGGSITALGGTTSYIVLRFVTADGTAQVWSVPRAGGDPVRLDIPWTAANGHAAPLALDAAGDTLVFTRPLGSGRVDIAAIDADGSNARTLVAGVVPVGTVRPADASPLDSPIDSTGYGVNARSRAPAQPDAAPLGGQIASVLYCAPAGGRDDCAGGALTQLDLAGMKLTTLGTVPAVTDGSRLRAWADATRAGAFTLVVLRSGSASTVRDVYVATAGSAGSLATVVRH